VHKEIKKAQSICVFALRPAKMRHSSSSKSTSSS